MADYRSVNPRERELMSMKRHFANAYLPDVENPIKRMENRMRCFPKSIVDVPRQVYKPVSKINRSDATSKYEIHSDIEESSGQDLRHENSQEPVTLNAILNPIKKIEKSKTIDSEAYKNSIFHPDYRFKFIHEREDRKKEKEVNDLYSALLKRYADTTGEEWTDLILKVNSQKKKKTKRTHKSKSRKSSDNEIVNLSNVDNSFISKNTKGAKRRGQIFKHSEKSSLKEKWDDVDWQQNERPKEGSESGHTQSEFNNSHAERHSSIRDSIDKRKTISEQQDNESVKALLNGYEDQSLDINAYFKRNYGDTNEVYTGSLEQLNVNNALRKNTKDYS